MIAGVWGPWLPCIVSVRVLLPACSVANGRVSRAADTAIAGASEASVFGPALFYFHSKQELWSFLSIINQQAIRKLETALGISEAIDILFPFLSLQPKGAGSFCTYLSLATVPTCFVPPFLPTKL